MQRLVRFALGTVGGHRLQKSRMTWVTLSTIPDFFRKSEYALERELNHGPEDAVYN